MTDRQAKEFVLKYCLDLAGYVRWCKTPPMGMGFQVHKFTIVDAINEAMGFVSGKARKLFRHGTLYCGIEFTMILVMLPYFTPDEGCDKVTVPCYQRIGTLGDYIVHLDCKMPRHQAMLTREGYKALLEICEVHPPIGHFVYD